MPQTTLQLCWPGLLIVAGLLLALRILVGVCGAQRDLGRLRTLHSNQQGSVQSLSFILALPVFIMILMGIVQMSQMMIARIYVQYAAVAAVRSAIVWIPASIADGDELANEIRDLRIDTEQDPQADGTYYRVQPASHKAFRIQMAAAQAMMAIAPSGDTVDGAHRAHRGNIAIGAIQRAYESLVPAARGDANIRRRLANKLAYSLQNTTVDIRIFHPATDPELVAWGSGSKDPPWLPSFWQFYPNEIGFQDSVTVTVKHNVALLPGPGRLLARAFQENRTPGDGPSPLSQQEDVIVWPISASATMGNEGEQSTIPYDHYTTGLPL